MATLHPAALLRNPNNKPLAFGDFVALRDKINEICTTPTTVDGTKRRVFHNMAQKPCKGGLCHAKRCQNARCRFLFGGTVPCRFTGWFAEAAAEAARPI